MSARPVWRSLVLNSLKRNKSVSSARYMQLATVRTDGRPANRTVVFRGFVGNEEKISFVTDARSEKMRQAAWQSLSDRAREQFLWPNPGEARKDPSQQLLMQGPVPGPEALAPDTFCLVTMDATEVDYLQLKQERRTKFTRPHDNNQEWLVTDTNP